MDKLRSPCETCDYRHQSRTKKPCDNCELPGQFDDALKEGFFPIVKFLRDSTPRKPEPKKEIKEIEDLKRVKLNEAMKEEKILVKLKDKKKIEYDYDVRKEEKKILDEIALSRHGKSNLK